jgi:hypothetical protein
MELFHVKSPWCRSNTSSRNPPQHAAEGYRETERITQRRRRDSNCQFARLGQLRVVRFWRKHQPIDRLATCSRGHHEQNRTPETPAPGVRPNFKPKAIRVTIQNTIICTRTRDKGAEKEARNPQSLVRTCPCTQCFPVVSAQVLFSRCSEPEAGGGTDGGFREKSLQRSTGMIVAADHDEKEPFPAIPDHP